MMKDSTIDLDKHRESAIDNGKSPNQALSTSAASTCSATLAASLLTTPTLIQESSAPPTPILQTLTLPSGDSFGSDDFAIITFCSARPDTAHSLDLANISIPKTPPAAHCKLNRPRHSCGLAVTDMQTASSPSGQALAEPDLRTSASR